MSGAHARFSPSAAHRWMHCTASLQAEKQYPSTSGADAEYGTAAHELSEWVLKGRGRNCSDFIGSVTRNGVTVDEEMAEYAQVYVDRILEYADGNELFVEQVLDFSAIVGVEGQFGTADAIIITRDHELQVHDLKFGRGQVVSAERNEQLMIYALAAYHLYSLMWRIDSIRLVISQPRRERVSEWTLTVEELYAFADTLRQAVTEANENPVFSPGEKQCRWCKHKANCDALAEWTHEQVADSFSPLGECEVSQHDADTLAAKMDAVETVRMWADAVEKEVWRRMMDGDKIPGYKVVKGRAGNAAWVDPEKAEEVLKAMRLRKDEMYDFKLISPTKAEKFLKDSPRRLSAIREYIHRPEGKLTVARESDPKPAVEVKTVLDSFTKLELED